MGTRLMSAAAALFAACLIATDARAEDPQHEHPPYQAPPAFEPFLGLDGTWQGTATHSDGNVHDTVATYRTTAAGSAVAETIFVDTPHEMITMYFAEGDTPMLTHYCGLANQPTMAGVFDPDAKTVTYTYIGGTNIADDNMPHMHSVVYEFVNDDQIKVTWTLYAQGEEAGNVVLDLERQTPESAAAAAMKQ